MGWATFWATFSQTHLVTQFVLQFALHNKKLSGMICGCKPNRSFSNTQKRNKQCYKNRVNVCDARWFIFRPKVAGQLIYFTAIWFILWTFGIFFGNLVYFPRFGTLWLDKSGNPGQSSFPETFAWNFWTKVIMPEAESQRQGDQISPIGRFFIFCSFIKMTEVGLLFCATFLHGKCVVLILINMS
jgi:hypothetical protein